MKKTLLTMACLLLGGMMAWAQKAAPAVGCMYEGVPFNNASANGKWLVSNVQSAVYIFDVDGNKVYEFMDENYVDAYFAGYGRSVTNDGMVVGMMQKLVDPETYTSETNAAYFKNGEWVVLPQMSGVKAGMNAAHACTPDGRVICGALAPDGVNLGSSGQALLFPVVWTLGADNQYVCEKLPCPEKDFTGRFPQYITAMDISDDGNTIVGQIRDYSGFYIVPILYTRNSEGQWSYQVVAGDVVYDAEKFKNLPAWKESPDYPEQSDYITAEEQAAYDAAEKAYWELYQRCQDGDADWDDLGEYPEMENFMSEAERQAYQAAVSQYYADLATWEPIKQAYDAALDEGTTGKSCLFNSIHLSPDGRYILADFSEPDPNADPFSWVPSALYSNYVVDVSKDDKAVYVTKTNMVSTGIQNNGNYIVAGPASDMARSSYVATAGSEKVTPIIDWCRAQRKTAAANFMDENLHFEVTNYIYDPETGMESEEVVGDSLITGTALFTADGEHIVSWFSNPTTYQYVSYTIDLSDEAQSGIRGVEVAEGEAQVLRREYFNLQGQRIAAPTKGVYLEKVTTNKGSFTRKQLR